MKKLDKIFNKSKRMNINKNSKIVIMSDCHRGIGNALDNFLDNKKIFESALRYYYNNGFTYIELGDGDEMWEVKNYKKIIQQYIDSFKLLKKFNDVSRLIMIYGNHDMAKKSFSIMKKYFYTYYNEITKKDEELLRNLIPCEALVLNYNNLDIFLIHGHQVDFLNSNLWKLSRFLVRYVWRFLEYGGINDPTSAAKNNKVKNSVERKLQKWSNKNNTILIAGHTHRAIFPLSNNGLYFNDGSCIHPDGITCIEIINGCIRLVKWINEKNNGYSLVNKIVMAHKIIDG